MKPIEATAINACRQHAIAYVAENTAPLSALPTVTTKTKELCVYNSKTGATDRTLNLKDEFGEEDKVLSFSWVCTSGDAKCDSSPENLGGFGVGRAKAGSGTPLMYIPMGSATCWKIEAGDELTFTEQVTNVDTKVTIVIVCEK